MTVQSVSDVHVSLMARRCRLQTLLSSIVDAVCAFGPLQTASSIMVACISDIWEESLGMGGLVS